MLSGDEKWLKQVVSSFQFLQKPTVSQPGFIVVFSRSKKDKSKGVVKPDGSDPEPEGLTLLVPDIQRTAEIVYAATTSLRQANQGTYAHKQPVHLSFFMSCTL